MYQMWTNKRILIVDIETDSLDASTIHVVVTKDRDTKQVNSFRQAWEFNLYLREHPTLLVMHNGISFDAPTLNKLWGSKIKSNECIDTLVLSRLFNPVREGGHSLEAWGKRFGSHKIQFNAFENYSQEMETYCKQDVEITDRLFSFLLKEGENFSEDSVRLEHEVQHIISKQEKRGFYFDVQSASILLADLMQKAKDIENKITEEAGVTIKFDKEIVPRYTRTGELSKVGLSGFDNALHTVGGPFSRIKYIPFNISSRQQISDYLIRKGWKPNKYTPTGQPIVDEKILSNVNIDEAQDIALYLTLEKRIAQIKPWIEAADDDGRVHGTVRTCGTITTRMSHSDPNMAQVPSTRKPYGEECRKCWKPAEGNKLIGIDASGLELRMLAHYMNDQQYTKEVVDGDIHTANQLAARLESRDQAKTFIYAFIYGAGDAKIGSIVGGSKLDGKRLKERFLNSTPALAKLRDRVFRAATTGRIKGLDGRYLQIRSEHSALNVLLQGAGAIVMKKALVIFYKDLLTKRLKPSEYFVANIHDEWQLDVPEHLAESVANVGVNAIRKTAAALGLNCPLDGEYKIGNNWAETH
jgi:DNA polymerase I